MGKCRSCGKGIPEFMEPFCIRCEHIIGKTQADLVVEFRTTENVV